MKKDQKNMTYEELKAKYIEDTIANSKNGLIYAQMGSLGISPDRIKEFENVQKILNDYDFPSSEEEIEEEKYFLEEQRNGSIELFEKDGTFFNHDKQDLLIATFYNKEKAESVCELLNSSSTLK